MFNLIFDIDGTLVKADGKIRTVKYKKLFKWALKQVNSKDYQGCSKLFEDMKQQYDEGVEISPRYYKLINKNTAKVLQRLSLKYNLYFTSVAGAEISILKMKRTKILKYFNGYVDFESFVKNHKKDFNVVIDDRPKKFAKDIFFVKFEHGQYKDMPCDCNQRIYKLEEL